MEIAWVSKKRLKGVFSHVIVKNFIYISMQHKFTRFRKILKVLFYHFVHFKFTIVCAKLENVNGLKIKKGIFFRFSQNLTNFPFFLKILYF